MKVVVSVAGKFQAFNLAQQLLKRGYLKRLITSYPKFEVIKYGIPKKLISSVLIKEILFRGWSHMPLWLRKKYDPSYYIGEIFDIIASWKIDLSDIFVGFSNKSLHSLRKAKKNGAITIVERGSSHIEFQNEILNKEYKLLGLSGKRGVHPKTLAKELIEYQEADYISVPSKFVKDTFISKGINQDKIIHVPYGVDLSLFKKVPKNDDKFRVIFGGGLSLRKGVHYLLQAFYELNLPNSELLLIGRVDNEIIPFLKKYEGCYIHKEYYPLSELHKIFSQGSVFVLPSLEEGLAMVQPMAMACELPVICTTNTGGADIIRDKIDGFIIPIRDVDKIKETVKYMFDNPLECKKMGESARQRVSNGFTWDDYGRKMINEYERILKIRDGKNK